MSFYENRTPKRWLLPDCPYRHAQKQLQQSVCDDRPFYRTIGRKFGDVDPLPFMGDTYEGMTMIDATQLRECGHNCLCRTFRCPCITNPNPLAFIVVQDVGETKVHIRSDSLLHSLIGLGVNISKRVVLESELLRRTTVIQQGLKSKSKHWIYNPLNNDSCERKLFLDYLSILNAAHHSPSIYTPVLDSHWSGRLTRPFEKSRVNQNLDTLENSFWLSDPELKLKPSPFSDFHELVSEFEGRFESRPSMIPCFCLSKAHCGSPEVDLIEAVRYGSESETWEALCSTDGAFNRRVFNPNAIIGGSTALNEAVRTGCQPCIIDLLISEGADVNVIAPCGTPLSIAVETRSKASMKLLLEHGADPVPAMIFLNNNETSSRQRQRNLQILTDTMNQCKEEAQHSNITQLRHNFREEYRSIARAARQISPDQHGDWRTVQERNTLLEWKIEVNNSAKGAWRTGVGMLRKLCNGDLPRNVNEVIMGIALARSMAMILGKEIDEGILHDLNEDLSRWQVLFTDQARFAFSNAVRRIWGVHLADSFGGGCSVAEEIFEDFQNMAEKLMEKAHDVFGLGEQMNPSDSDRDRDGGSGKDTDLIRHDQDSRLGDYLMDKQQYAFDRGPDQTTLIWLMAGVVFACCIAVLLVLHCTQASTDVLTNYYDTITKAVFFASVGHILEHEQDLPDVRNGFIEDEVRESISHGTILSVSALKRSINACSQNWMMSEPERYRLIRGCDNWFNFIQMQISKSVIELYLQQISSDKAQGSSNADSPEAELLQEAISSDDTEMSSFQFSSSSRPSEEQHTPSSAQETLLQSDLDNADAAPRVNPSHRASGRKLYACDICNHLFSRSNLKKHKQDVHNPKGKKTHKCTVCGRGFGRDDNRRHHEEKKHGLRFEDRRKQRRRSD